MSVITGADKKILYTKVRTILGYPYASVDELDDKALDTLYQISLEDYGALVSDWLINQQWMNLQGLEVDNANFVQALTTKSLDYERNFAFAYGKQTGIGTNSPWELKRDFIEVDGYSQVYSIPAGREVNEVLWSTPPMIGNGSMGSGNDSEADSFSAGTAGWVYGGIQAQPILPTYGVLLSAQDSLQRKRVLQSELSYKIVGGPNGTKQLFLYPIPGSQDEIKGRSGKHLAGTRVWYWYYETNSKGRKKCLEMNEDIIRLPDEVPMTQTAWTKMNQMTQTRIRKILTAHAQLWLGRVRGKFKGELAAFGDGQGKSMDYEMYLAEGKQGMEEIIKEIMESLDKLRPVNMMEERARVSEALNKTLSYQPHRNPFVMF